MEQDIEKENERLKDLLYSKIMFIEQLKKDYRNLVKDIEEIAKNYNEARDLAIELRTDNKHLNDLLDNALNRIESLTDKTTGETIYRSNLVNKLKHILQEIKAIAEAPKPFIDFSETKTAIEVEYDYAAICKELELRLYKVLELITKAEEE